MLTRSGNSSNRISLPLLLIDSTHALEKIDEIILLLSFLLFALLQYLTGKGSRSVAAEL